MKRSRKKGGRRIMRSCEMSEKEDKWEKRAGNGVNDVLLTVK